LIESFRKTNNSIGEITFGECFLEKLTFFFKSFGVKFSRISACFRSTSTEKKRTIKSLSTTAQWAESPKKQSEGVCFC